MKEASRKCNFWRSASNARRGRAALIVLALILSGCVASINEQHHIATFGQKTPLNPTGFANVLRITIRGRAGFTNVRYIAGTYDENAADLFLNNAKASSYSSTTGATEGPNQIFAVCLPADDDGNGKQTVSTAGGGQPSSSSDQKGTTATNGDDDKKCSGSLDGETFLIIMSTNANAISETIGAFAENEITIKALNYLLNRDVFDAQQLQAELAPQVGAERKAMLASLQAMFDNYESNEATSIVNEIAILQTIAVALDPTGDVSFTEIGEAEEWFSELD